MPKLSDDDKRAIIARRLSDTTTGTDSELRSDRENALNWYYGRPIGNEIDGRAQVVTKDLMDTIEWMMPSLMRVLMSKECVKFDPTGPDDDLMAKRETAAITHLIWKKNPGFMILYNWIKDGLMQKVGYLHYWWEESKKTSFERYTGLTDEQLVMTVDALTKEYDVKVMGSRQDEQGLWDIKIRKTKKYRGCPKMEVYPPDEVIVDKNCRGSIKTAIFVGLHRRNVMRSELVEMGYTKARVKKLTSYSFSESTEERRARDTVSETEEGDEDNGVDWATQELTLLKCWTYLDADDDGVAELREMLLAGNDILEDEEVPEIPWESWTPTPVPHRHIGLSVYDRMEELLRINTALWRGILDNTYFTQNPRIAFDRNTVDGNALGVNRPGGHVPCNGPPGAGAMMPIPVQPMQGQILPVIDLVKQSRDRRTGVGDMSAGLDADTLAKATKGAYIDAKTSSSQLVEAVATVFAHTALAPLYQSLHGLVRHNQDWSAHEKLGDEWVEVDPSQWLEREQMTVSIGSTTREEVRQNLGVMAGAQTQAAQVPGLIQPKNVYALFKDMQDQLGFEGRNYATDPDSDEYRQWQESQQAPPPDPYLQAEQLKSQTNLQKATIDAQLKSRELDQKGAIDVAKLELEYSRDLAAPGVGAELATRGNGQASGARRTTTTRQSTQ